MAAPFRFLEAEQPQWFREPVLVRCPRCGSQATADLSAQVAIGPDDRPRLFARLICTGCAHSVSTEFDSASWLGPVDLTARGRCGQCGRPLQRSLGRRRKLPARTTTSLHCPGCQHRTVVATHVTPAHSTDAVDPWFGLPLWLRTSCCGEVLWARNAGHLQFLANYVGATIREREPNQNSSIVSRLPKWMKAAKNRTTIMGCIAHLQETLLHAKSHRHAV